MSTKVKNWIGESVYLGTSKAIVIDNKDPDQKGRIKVLSPVFGTSPFIPYLSPDDGFFSVPDIGSIVRIEAAGGDSDYLVAYSTVIDGNNQNNDVSPLFRRQVPTNRGWVSPGSLDSNGKPIVASGGHSLELDDGLATVSNSQVTQTAESRGVRLTTAGGHSVKMTEEGSDGNQQNRIEITTSQGHVVEMIDENDGGDANRVRIRNSSGTIFIDVDLANDIIEIDAENVKIGTNAMQALVRGDEFRELFNQHTHISSAPGIPTSVSIEQMDPSSANTHLSSKHRLE